jgi:hypothetical protein
VKNLTRWLRFLTVVKLWAIGTGFALIAVNATHGTGAAASKTRLFINKQ